MISAYMLLESNIKKYFAQKMLGIALLNNSKLCLWSMSLFWPTLYQC